MTYSYTSVRLSPPKPTSDDPANLLRTHRINFSMRPQHVCMAWDPTVIWCLFSREALRILAQTLHCQKLESLSYIKAAMQKWKWVIFCDPWPMWHITQLTRDPHDPWPMAIMVINHYHFILRMGLGWGVAWWYWTTLSILRTKNRRLNLSHDNRPNWVSSFLMPTKNKVRINSGQS